jgi:hypothetical protein
LFHSYPGYGMNRCFHTLRLGCLVLDYLLETSSEKEKSLI